MKQCWKILLSVLLTAALLVSFCACDKGPNDDNGPTDNPTEGPTEEPTPTEVPDVMIDKTLDAPYASAFTVSKTFASNMVVQRNEYIRVWGWADESENGKKVSGEFMGMFTEALIENGEWCLQFKAKLKENAEMGHSMRIYTDTQEVIFEDVLVGDVYMVIGQSNCAYSMQIHWSFFKDPEMFSQKGIDETAPIRINYQTQEIKNGIARGTTEVAKDIKAKKAWKIAKKGVISTFSAIGYMFAANYCKLTENKVPVGMIQIDGNGRPLGAFLPNEVADKYKTDTWSDSKGYYVTTGVNAEWGRFMYNEYMYPFEKMAMAGIVWYQGESDLQDREATRYAEVYTAFINYMRGTHNLVHRDFPVYFIEFPPIYTKPANYKGANNWAYMDVGKIRAIMGSMVTMDANMYQVASSDLWNDREFWNSLHPNCKYEQSLRAAKIACAVNGEGGITLDNASGPIIESVTYSADGKTATLKFRNVGEGLKTSDGGEVKGMQGLSDKNKLSGKTVTAKITGKDTIEVKADFELAGVAYNAITTYSFGNEINLENSAGIPCGAFLMNK